MTNQNCSNGHCYFVSSLICIAWLLVTSGLLFLTWNHVIAAITKVKTVKFWQALLFMVTLGALWAPKICMSHRYHRGGCPYSAHASCCRGESCEHHCCGHMKCHDCDGDDDDKANAAGGKKGECPFSGHGGKAEAK